MKKQYDFIFLHKSQISDTLPILFDILYENMEKITPFYKTHHEAKQEWLEHVTPAMKREQRKIVLMYDKDILAGFSQYYVNETTFMIEEIQLKPKYQKTMLLYQFCMFMKKFLPSKVTYIEAYADKRNINSQKFMEALNMKIIDKTGKFYHYQGLKGKSVYLDWN